MTEQQSAIDNDYHRQQFKVLHISKHVPLKFTSVVSAVTGREHVSP